MENSRVNILTKNYKEIIKILLGTLSFEQINSQDNEGDAPLHQEVIISKFEIIKELLQITNNDLTIKKNNVKVEGGGRTDQAGAARLALFNVLFSFFIKF